MKELQSSGHSTASSYLSQTNISLLENILLFSCPSNRLWRPIGLWDVEVPTFSRQSVQRSALHVCQLYHPERSPVLISVRGWVDTRAIVRLEGLRQLKKFNYLIGNRTRDLPACSIVPQPTTLPRAPAGNYTEFILQTWGVLLWTRFVSLTTESKGELLVNTVTNIRIFKNM
jgi:hypothetical protein